MSGEMKTSLLKKGFPDEAGSGETWMDAAQEGPSFTLV